jgi:hypothetical protein
VGVVDQLYVVGAYDAAKSTLRLSRWYAIVPFTEYLVKDQSVIPHEVYKKRRVNLRRSDFERTADFDPASPEFNPFIYQRNRARVRQATAASSKRLQDRNQRATHRQLAHDAVVARPLKRSVRRSPTTY